VGLSLPRSLEAVPDNLKLLLDLPETALKCEIFVTHGPRVMYPPVPSIPQGRERRDSGFGDSVAIARLWTPASYMPLLTDEVKTAKAPPLLLEK
jgi:hypothetical protein